MSERRRRRPRENPAVKPNAVHLTVWDPQGGPVHPSVLDDIQRKVQQVVDDHKLLSTSVRT